MSAGPSLELGSSVTRLAALGDVHAWRRPDLMGFVLAALMSVKEMAKGITYDDPIKTRCDSQYRGSFSENIASL